MREKVVFLLEQDSDDSVFAAFPRMTGTCSPETMGCYHHVGQHGAADMDYVAACKPATPEQYAALQRELESIGYVLDVQTEITDDDFAAREDELERIA